MVRPGLDCKSSTASDDPQAGLSHPRFNFSRKHDRADADARRTHRDGFNCYDSYAVAVSQKESLEWGHVITRVIANAVDLTMALPCSQRLLKIGVCAMFAAVELRKINVKGPEKM